MKGLEKIINVIASAGAAVVIVGALFKILHLEGANQMLMVGMLTEAAIFILLAILYVTAKPEKDYEWERVYPELSKDFQGELPKSTSRGSFTGGSGLTIPFGTAYGSVFGGGGSGGYGPTPIPGGPGGGGTGGGTGVAGTPGTNGLGGGGGGGGG